MIVLFWSDDSEIGFRHQTCANEEEFETAVATALYHEPGPEHAAEIGEIVRALHAGDVSFEDGWMARRTGESALDWLLSRVADLTKDRDWHDDERARHLLDAVATRRAVATARDSLKRLADLADELLPALPCEPFDIERYIAELPWSDAATDHEKTLVAGNLRRLFTVLQLGD